MDKQKLIETNKELFLKSLDYLEYSYQKVKKLSPETLDIEELETWDSFMARFSRAADLFVSKYLRAKISFEEPGFRGSVRDLLNTAEKLNLIDSATNWIEIKEIRNMQAHEYKEENLSQFFKAALKETTTIISQKSKL